MQVSSISRAYHGSLKGQPPFNAKFLCYACDFWAQSKFPPITGKMVIFLLLGCAVVMVQRASNRCLRCEWRTFFKVMVLFLLRAIGDFTHKFVPMLLLLKKDRKKKKCRNAHESVKPLPDVILTSVKVLWNIPEFFGDPKKTDEDESLFSWSTVLWQDIQNWAWEAGIMRI